jgi:hypothetical protein
MSTRKNDGKPKLSMLFEASDALIGVTRVLEFGANKYERGGWKNADRYNTTEIIDSLLRHTLAYMDGEDNDPDSGLPHVDHITANALFLGVMARKPEKDNRNGKE